MPPFPPASCGRLARTTGCRPDPYGTRTPPHPGPLPGRDPGRAGILLASLALSALPLVHSAPRAEAAGPARCAPGAFPVLGPGAADGVPQGLLVALRPDVGPVSGGTQVTLNGTGLAPYTRVLFGFLGPDGCFTGREAPDVVVLSDTALIATAPQGPVAGAVSVVAATPCGQRTDPLTSTYVD
ncbi:IPT/TIG domain-containing protein [Streptomyces avidinii]|uniref:IPT/TIG domain-containing protein n=1 Tax=Streptomyces avidinii TaxID=1895 RepID=UPI00386FEF94|nr:IPT/TIG domain-containing protein [Streptomyces avidinii]WST50050.1 IPT/TIG domain-containing protein [Streptomyces avidinii]